MTSPFQVPLFLEMFPAKRVIFSPLKGLRESTQHGYQVYKIWIYMSPDLKVQQMFDVKKLHVWLETFLKTMAPGTAKSYLSSLTIFIDFLVCMCLHLYTYMYV
jgi:hypothetical protein